MFEVDAEGEAVPGRLAVDTLAEQESIGEVEAERCAGGEGDGGGDPRACAGELFKVGIGDEVVAEEGGQPNRGIDWESGVPASIHARLIAQRGRVLKKYFSEASRKPR
jgi:hypothetical protein